jgi:hypothetical protein
MSTANRRSSRLRQTQMSDFPLLNQIFHCSGDILDRHFGIDAVLIEQVDAIGPQAPKRGFRHLLDMLRTAVQPLDLTLWFNVESELGGDDHPIANGR